MKLFRSRIFVACVASTLTAIVVGGVAWATTQNPVDNNGVVHGCYNPTTGAIALNVTGSCPSSGKTAAIAWNQQGQPGPQGIEGPAGPQGSQGAPGPGPYEEKTDQLYNNALAFGAPNGSQQIGLPGNGCVQIAAPPAGKALVVTQIAMGTMPATIIDVHIWRDASCSSGLVDSALLGNLQVLVTLPFAPGVGVPSGQALYVSEQNGFFDFNVSVTGYVTAS